MSGGWPVVLLPCVLQDFFGEEGVPGLEASKFFGTEFRDTLFGFVDGFLAVEMSFGEELIGIADNFFLDGFREEIAMG